MYHIMTINGRRNIKSRLLVLSLIILGQIISSHQRFFPRINYAVVSFTSLIPITGKKYTNFRNIDLQRNIWDDHRFGYNRWIYQDTFTTTSIERKRTTLLLWGEIQQGSQTTRQHSDNYNSIRESHHTGSIRNDSSAVVPHNKIMVAHSSSKNKTYSEIAIPIVASVFVATTAIIIPTIADASVATTTTSELLNNHQLIASTENNEAISGFIAGGLLAFTKTIVKYPMDTATVRLQMINTTYTITEPIQLFSNAYVGIALPLVFNVPASAVFFAVKDAVTSALKSFAVDTTTNVDIATATLAATAPEQCLLIIQQLCTSRTFRTCVAVGVAQFPYWLVRNPSEVIKTKEQAGTSTIEFNTADTKHQNNTIQFIQQLLFKEQNINSTNIRSTMSAIQNMLSDRLNLYYTGYWENIIYAYPADVFKFVIYEQLFKAFSSSSEISKETIQYAAASACYGAISTGLSQYITTPLDVVRNRIMADNTTTAPSANTIDSTELSFMGTYVESLIKLAKVEGFDGLFAGAIPRLMKALVSGAIQFVTYEETKQALISFLSK